MNVILSHSFVLVYLFVFYSIVLPEEGFGDPGFVVLLRKWAM